MVPFDPVILERLKRVLVFLSVSGGAALLSKRERRVLAAVGDVDEASALAALGVILEPTEETVHVAPGGLVTDVGRQHRLFIRVPSGLPDPAFGDRLRRARDLIERFGLHLNGQTPPAAPGSAPAHAVVFAPYRRQRRA